MLGEATADELEGRPASALADKARHSHDTICGVGGGTRKLQQTTSLHQEEASSMAERIASENNQSFP